ncbi:MAG: hypothetical protein ACK4E5_01350 [Erythrobacter cryptus]
MAGRAPTLIFVYNADGGVMHALAGMVHKLVAPQGYPCRLCALTYGAVAMRREWRAFLAAQAPSSLFLYRDELREDLDGRDLPLPAVLWARGPGQPRVLIGAEELAALGDLDALIGLLRACIAALG